MRQLLALSIAVATTLFLAACGSGSGVAVGPAPSALSYSAVVATYSVCESIQPNAPTLVGGESGCGTPLESIRYWLMSFDDAFAT